MEYSNQAVSNYLGEIKKVYKDCKLDKIQKEDIISDKFGKIGALRSKFNQNGIMDFTEDDLAQAIENLKFAIGNLILFFIIGLTDFEFENTNYGPIGLPKGNKWTSIDIAFFYFVDDSFERLYSFWNRIAYFLNIFFKVIPNDREVLFPKTIDKLASNKKVNSNCFFKSLKHFKDTEYTNFNKLRAKIVHKEFSSSTYFNEALRSIKNVNKLSDLQRERDELPNYFLKHFERTIQGIDEAISLIENNIM
jgi:hypothetical protein